MEEARHFEKTVYLAHPVSGDVEANLEAFKTWYRWALLHKNVIPLCPWFSCCHALDDNSPEERKAGIEMDHAFILRARHIIDELWLCGDRLSEGMKAEMELAANLGITIRSFIGSKPRIGLE